MKLKKVLLSFCAVALIITLVSPFSLVIALENTQISSQSQILADSAQISESFNLTVGSYEYLKIDSNAVRNTHYYISKSSSESTSETDSTIKTALTGEEIAAQIKLLSPYLIVKEHNLVEIDIAKAEKDNINDAAIKLVKKFYDNQNRIITVTLNGGTFDDVKLDTDFNKIFEEYMKHLAKTEFVLKASCSVGDALNPDPCPNRDELIASTSLAKAQKFAYDSGYHRTATYAGGGLPENPARDFTKPVEHNNCSKGVYRNHMVLSDNKDGTYKVLRQLNEPNPEIHSYTHPHMDWAHYCYWWHQTYC
ncbi:hypothetical protein [Paenibacillus agilis]|uniref:Uncharacterized protein n=1 Tax=Paenibacillus agilis TaxID=3020863 RepID=A0A559IW21_9BACL|nr:hypothetical protein [Paenibacillus agilis]TVX91837.1 hypothetical protein FPZ44_01430 [Paenibacillus agilis]